LEARADWLVDERAQNLHMGDNDIGGIDAFASSGDNFEFEMFASILR
jgi:hypothetical protein